MKKLIIYLLLLIAYVQEAKADIDPKFQIYLCFGQSNMEGASPAMPEDQVNIDNRFLTLATTDFTTPNPIRITGNWYTAYPPIISDKNTIGILDFFGRAMVAALPADYRVGVVPVAIGSADIRAFMSELVGDYISSNPPYFLRYGNDPYKRLVDMARIAQQSGVIKGILLHQGEKNMGQEEWPQWVKTVYDRLISDLGLNAAEVPLLVGEVVNASEKGVCAEHNKIIAKVPYVIPTAHVISSVGCSCAADNLHFDAVGYRILGKRYATTMLKLLGFPAHKDANYQLPTDLQKFYQATRIETSKDISLEPNKTDSISVTAYFEDGHQENIMHEAVVAHLGSGIITNGTELKAVTNERSRVTVGYTDFMGNTFKSSFYVNRSGSISGIINDIVNFLMGKPSDTFSIIAGDVNNDGKVNAADIVHLIKEK